MPVTWSQLFWCLPYYLYGWEYSSQTSLVLTRGMHWHPCVPRLSVTSHGANYCLCQSHHFMLKNPHSLITGQLSNIVCTLSQSLRALTIKGGHCYIPILDLPDMHSNIPNLVWTPIEDQLPPTYCPGSKYIWSHDHPWQHKIINSCHMTIGPLSWSSDKPGLDHRVMATLEPACEFVG